MELPGPRRHGSPAIWLAGALLATFLVLAGLALEVPAPRSLADEVRYVIAAGALAEGEGLGLRGDEYEFGPTYPALLAAILAVVPDRDTAYPLFKLVNALLFALAIVPIYFLARRLLPHWWSLGVAVLSIAIPTSVSVSLVMTESAAYPAAVLAILAVIRALERPTIARQLIVLATIALAFSIRSQFAVLFPAYVAALGVLWIVAPSSRPRSLAAVGRLWPTLVVLGAGLVVATASLVTGGAPVGTPGAYDELWSRYDLVDVAELAVYHLAGLEIYIAVIPLAVAPIVLAGLARDARAGSASAAGFFSAFLTVNASLILVAAAFASLPAGDGNLHDRYLFYVVPLWLVVLAVWLRDGLPRPLVATVLGVVVALVLPAVTPFELIGGEGSEASGAVTYFWAFVNSVAFETFPDEISGRGVLALFVVALVVLTLVVPPRLKLAIGATVAAAFIAATAVAWRDVVRTAEDFDAALTDERTWVDDALGDDAAVTALYVSAECGWATWTSSALLMTEFFNEAVARAAHVDDPDQSLLPSTRVRLSRDGAIVTAARTPFVADAVLAARGVDVEGRRVASGTTVPLVLWKVDGPVRLTHSRTLPDVQRAICAAERTPAQSR